ncbi:MAG: Rne/Rng family ribonuclease, partial [Cyanobacteria bacterium]|nr:Rne/Rng family ribonuclease [Cyanobacteriota bacterium]
NISLPGRFLVLMPESKGISISRKIEQPSERSRLKSVVSLIKPTGVGVIIRTEADQQKESDIQEDFETLIERWHNIVAMADSASPPTLLYRDQDLLYRVIREVVTDDVKEIHVDTNFGQQRAQQLLQNWNMEKNIKVNLYSGNQSILIGMNVDKEIKQALQTKVPLPSGGYLYIQPTEALCVIDVNSGKFTSLQSQADTIRQTNLESCKEIARQLRLRNIGGMIIVDFIDMESRADKLAILEAFENELSPDKSKPQIGQLSDLGLVEMTRHRQGQALSEIFTKRCIACNGTGHATEEFNWAPPMLDGDPRTSGGRPGSNRNKLPLRQPRPQQQPQGQRGGNGGGSSGGGGGGGGSQQALQPAVSIKKVMEDGKIEMPQSTKTAGGSILQQATQSKAKPTIPDDKAFDEILKDRISQKLGIRFANTVKLAHTPPGINSVLIRINPRSCDILTLVDTIEGSQLMPASLVSSEDDENEEGISEGPGEAEAQFSEEEGGERPFQVQSKRAHQATLPRGLPTMPNERPSRDFPRDRRDGHPLPSRKSEAPEEFQAEELQEDLEVQLQEQLHELLQEAHMSHLEPDETREPLSLDEETPQAQLSLMKMGRGASHHFQEEISEISDDLSEESGLDEDPLVEEEEIEVKPRRSKISSKRLDFEEEVSLPEFSEEEADEDEDEELAEKPKRRR